MTFGHYITAEPTLHVSRAVQNQKQNQLILISILSKSIDFDFDFAHKIEIIFENAQAKNRPGTFRGDLRVR